jgi:hypothetical protein
MGSFSLSGGVEVTGFISPTNPLDEYPVIDPLYGIDGFRNVNLLSDLDNIPNLRRRAGMVVGVSGGTNYYKLLPDPWNYTISDWGLFQTGGGGGEPFTGGTVSGETIFTNGVTATTISASTYLGLPLDIYVTGGTYNDGDAIFTNNTGGTFTVSGFYTGGTDFYVTGGTFDKNTETLTLSRNDNNDVQITGFTDVYTTGFTFDPSSYDISVELNDGNILTQNLSILSSDVTITGGTYDPLNGTATFTNNTGGTFNVTGFITGFTDIQVTGYTYQDNTFTIFDSSGNTFSATIDVVTGLTVNGTISATTYQNLPTDVRVTGATYSNNTFTFTNNTGGTFNTTFNTVTGLTVNGNLTATTISATTYQNLPVTADTFTTGFSYSNNTLTINRNQGQPNLSTTIDTMTGLTVNGNLNSTGNTSLQGLTATTISASTYQNLPVTSTITGGTYNFTGNTLTLNSNDGNNIPITGFTYERQSDYVYPYFYGGSAPLYTLTSTATWIIKRVDYTTPGSPITQSAIGSWDNRYILIYT